MGNGILEQLDGQIIVGEFNKGLPKGYCIVKYINGQTIFGNMNNGSWEGNVTSWHCSSEYNFTYQGELDDEMKWNGMGHLKAFFPRTSIINFQKGIFKDSLLSSGFQAIYDGTAQVCNSWKKNKNMSEFHVRLDGQSEATNPKEGKISIGNFKENVNYDSNIYLKCGELKKTRNGIILP
eukprot:GHVP01001387.1.p1 GENE.GHVP01001387.1~~GHVP01001387.1.p1  ORF type:complete len:192 (+),score=33.00 GHVP01001387.1:42-578(+)